MYVKQSTCMYIVHGKTTNYRGCPTHPDNGSSAGVTSLGKLLLVAALTEDALLLKDKHGVLQLFVTTGADKVLRVPGATHGCGKGSSGGKERGREGSDNLTSNAFIAQYSYHSKFTKVYEMRSLAIISLSLLFPVCIALGLQQNEPNEPIEPIMHCTSNIILGCSRGRYRRKGI